MKATTIVRAAMLSCIFASSAADAAKFIYTGSIQNYLVPATEYYWFGVAGAQGGGTDFGAGGGGALITGKLFLTAGTNLSILVGGQGQYAAFDAAGGGGGMSFFSFGLTPLVVAGGGSGSYWVGGNGQDGQVGVAIGGTQGQGGSGHGAGAGWYSDGDGGAGPTVFHGGGGHSAFTFAGGAGNYWYDDSGPTPIYTAPGGAGGFGGGGGGGYSCGGSGGGYSGGSNINCYVTTGGGSYVTPAAIEVNGISGGNKGLYIPGDFGRPYYYETVDGFVELLPGGVPEPSTWAMMILGFGFCGAMMRRNRLRKKVAA